MEIEMSADSHVLDSLPDYVLGSLTQAEAGAINEHLAACTICRTELSEVQGVTEQLALTAPGLGEPSPELKRQLMRRIQSLEPATSSRPVAAARQWGVPLRPVWGVAAALAIVLLAVSNLLLWQRLDNAEVLTSPQGMRAIALDSTDAAPEASAFVIMGRDGENGVLVVDALPQLDAAQGYQLWLMREDESTSGALFSVDESGYRGVRIVAPASLLSYSAARITIEPAEGSPYPTGDSVMDGPLPVP